MVNYAPPELDRTFSALSDPTRRRILTQLLQGKRSISELAKPHRMSLPAVMKHLDVLSDAGLIARKKTGRTVVCTLQAKPLQNTVDWLLQYRRFWEERFDRLDAYLAHVQQGESDS